MNSVEVLFRELHDVRVFYSQFLSNKVSLSRDTTGSLELITVRIPCTYPFFYSFSVLYTTITQLFFSVTHYTPEGIHIFFNTPSYITQFLYSQINGYIIFCTTQRIKESSSHCSKRESNRELKSIDLMLF